VFVALAASEAEGNYDMDDSEMVDMTTGEEGMVHGGGHEEVAMEASGHNSEDNYDHNALEDHQTLDGLDAIRLHWEVDWSIDCALSHVVNRVGVAASDLRGSHDALLHNTADNSTFPYGEVGH